MKEVSWDFPYPSQRAPVMARNVVSTSQPLAAQAGLRMLLLGGNAIDAALASAIALTVVEPVMNGIGGDLFALVWDGNSLHGLNSSGGAPLAWTPRYFEKYDQMPASGWDSVTVPGQVAGWVELSKKFGRLPFSDLFQPAIEYASEGFVVTPAIARIWASQVERLKDEPGFADAWLRNGEAPQAGILWKFPEQARTLALIARSNGSAFYEGELVFRSADSRTKSM